MRGSCLRCHLEATSEARLAGHLWFVLCCRKSLARTSACQCGWKDTGILKLLVNK